MNVESRYDEVAVEYDEWVGAGSALADPVFAELVGAVSRRGGLLSRVRAGA